MTVKMKDFLIIGGTTKAGTTSVYNYLACHPNVSASFRKEVNYFLDTEIEGPSICRYEGDIETYGNNFNLNVSNKIFIEASPGYLYSHGTPIIIKNELPNAKILFILREPYERLISWYKFARQTGTIKGISASDFIGNLFKIKKNSFPNYLEQGKYSIYIQRYYDVLGKANIKVVFYEDLIADPYQFMYDVCQFINIDSTFYSDFDYFISNKSYKMRSVWVHQRYIASRQMIGLNIPRAYYIIRKIWLHFKPLYLLLNTSRGDELPIPSHMKNMINTYYSGEKENLAGLLGRDIPWCSKDDPL